VRKSVTAVGLAPLDALGHNVDSLVRPGGQVARERHGHPADPAAEVQDAISGLESPEGSEVADEFLPGLSIVAGPDEDQSPRGVRCPRQRSSASITA
jgi:hypothetical protein